MLSDHRIIFSLLPPSPIRHIGKIIVQYKRIFLLLLDGRIPERRQDAEDYAMIAQHPEVFSSFYSIPTPYLEREFLKELRDFLLNGMRAFRRLLLGLHQDSGNVVDVFHQWQEWRTSNRG